MLLEADGEACCIAVEVVSAIIARIHTHCNGGIDFAGRVCLGVAVDELHTVAHKEAVELLTSAVVPLVLFVLFNALWQALVPRLRIRPRSRGQRYRKQHSSPASEPPHRHCV